MHRHRLARWRLLAAALLTTGLVAVVFALPAHATPPLYVPWPCGVTYNVTQGHNTGSHIGTWNAWAWDFGIPVGGEVVAPAAGTVKAMRMDSTVGGCNSAYAADANFVSIDFGDGTEAAFTHLQAGSSSLKIGDTVAQGQVVGRVGLSGWVCGAHLHFSINSSCAGSSCPTIQASFVGFGDPGAGTTITSNNCPAPPSDPDDALDAHHLDRTHSDLDGDGRADACGRSSAGIRCRYSNGTALATQVDGPALSDASGWGDPSNYSSLRMADVSGDGLADLCARSNNDFRCYLSTGTGFGDVWTIDDFKDSGGWDDPVYYTTIRMADVDGDGRTDVCARGASGMRCWPSTGSGFGTAITGPPMSDANGWAFPEFYTTIRAGDVNGDGRDDLCGRSSDAYHCWLSNGTGFPTLVDGPAWTDAGGWTDPKYYRTIRLADIDGDDRLDVCARTANDFRCHRWTGDGFGPAIVGPALSNDSGWGDEDNYATIRMGDIDGDGRDDLCARANAGLRCWRSTGTGFGARLDGPDYSNTRGWDAPARFRTLALADVTGDGRADVCGRESNGLQCWASDGDGFPDIVLGPSWSDASGWDAPAHFSTIRVGGLTATYSPCTASPEQCDGVDNDCDGEVDEGDACSSPDDVSSDTSDSTDTSDADASGADTASGDTTSADTATSTDTTATSDADVTDDVGVGDVAGDGTLTDAPGSRPDASPGADEATSPPTELSASDCACSTLGARPRGLAGCVALLALLALVSWRERRRAPHANARRRPRGAR